MDRPRSRDMAKLWTMPVELRIRWACRISSDLLASTKLGKFEPEGAKHRGLEAPGIVPMLRFHKRAILLSKEVNSKSVRGVTLMYYSACDAITVRMMYFSSLVVKFLCCSVS